MDRNDKYYLKQGRLELSMLDDDGEINHNIQLEVKMNQEIYHTLHAMGQILTKQEERQSWDQLNISKADQITTTNEIIHLPHTKWNEVSRQEQDANKRICMNENILESNVLHTEDNYSAKTGWANDLKKHIEHIFKL